MIDEALRGELLDLERRDEATRRRLARSGTLFDGYAAAMERVHRENARQLAAILDRGGWPGISRVGREGADAAWRVAQHAIGWPAFQRRCRALLEAAVAAGEAPRRHLAFLVDRIRFNERRPQVYGTVFDWDARGELSAWPSEDPEGLAARRRAAGLPPLERVAEEHRRRAAAEGESPPADFAGRRREIERWAQEVGWLDDRK